MQVSSVMIRDVVSIAPEATLAEAETLMHRGRFRHLPVTNEGRLVGVVSERDVRPPPSFSQEQQELHGGRSVRSAMRSSVITITSEDTLEDAARLLYENKIGCLPVMEGSHLAGIVTSSDVFYAFMRIMGLLQPSTRVEVHAVDMPATLAAVAEVARELHAGIATILTERDAPDGERTLVVRFATLQGPRVVAALRRHGLDVLSPDPALISER